jgi:threonylcarbamoyladenosine tRNA methylthiotransferase MtaB
MKSTIGKRRFSVLTLGCKLNQYESECIRQSLANRGWEYRDFNEGADVYIINTCTVTQKTDARCRNAVRKAKRISPEAVIIVTGCYSETQPERLSAMPETDLVLGNSQKAAIPGILDEMSGQAPDVEGGAAGQFPVIEEFLDHSRAFIKVQEGCDASCSYCIIPRARGGSSSVPADQILRQVDILQSNGYNEIVLTGIHIGRYGYELDGGMNLARLIDKILENTDDLRLRLSSIEVTEVTSDLIRLIKGTERIASHLHIPLQSGDDEILESMNRPYTTGYFSEKISELISECEGIAVGTDIMVGFPGETDRHFKYTYEFVSRLPLAYFHVFSFSRRPGTKAWDMQHQVAPEVKKKRSRKLIALGRRKKTEFMKSRIGRCELCLVQGPQHRFSRFSRTISGNYNEVYIKRAKKLEGKLVPINVTHYSRGRLYGNVITCDTATDYPAQEILP